MSDAAKPKRLSQNAKLAVDLGPLAVFFIAYFMGERVAGLLSAVTGRALSIPEGQEMFVALGAFLPAFAVAFAYSVWKERRIAPMLLVNGVIVGVLGTITLVLQNKTFFYMKPTVLYAFFALALGGGLVAGRNFLKVLFDGAFQLPDEAWRTLTIRYAGFFGVLAIANEIAWRYLTRECDLAGGGECAGEAVWVNLKLFGFTAASLLFTALQAPFLSKHMKEADASSGA